MSALIVLLVLLLFLRSFRAASIVFATVAFAALITVNVMYFAGYTLNLLTLMGLAMGFGLVVDSDADALSIQSDPDGSVRRVARGEVRRLEVSRGFRRRTVQGLVGGVVAWVAVVALYAAFDTLDESGVGEPLFIGGMVAAGGLVGSLIKTERWERVPGAVVSLRVSPRKRGVAGRICLGTFWHWFSPDPQRPERGGHSPQP